MDPAIGQVMPVLNNPLLSIHVSIIERNGDGEEADDGDGMDEGDCGKAAR